MCIYFSIVCRSYLGQVTRAPPRGKKVPERMDADDDLSILYSADD